MIYEFEGYKPVIHESAFIHPMATVTGNVIIGADVYVGPGASLRGDWGQIIIAGGCNIQENCTLHMFPGLKVELEENAHIGHGAVIHGAKIGKNVLIGMNSVILDGVQIGSNCIVGALSLVLAKTIVPEGKVLAGNPAKIIRDVSEEMLTWKTKGTELYQKLPAQLYTSLKECLPLREIEPHRPKQQEIYKTWKQG